MLGKASTLFFLINIGILSAQVDTLYKLDFTENASSQIKFSVYLDSLISNMYKNIELSDNIVNSCLQLIEEEKDQISDSLQMEFIINRIYLEYNKIKPIAAYQIISEASVGLNEMDITTDQIATFNYLKSFTDMSLGDLESAQISYYSEIERGKSIHDFKTVYRNLYSLAILLKEEGNYESSIKFLNESIEYWEQIKVEPSTMAFTHIELANSYIDLENYEKAFEHLAKAEKLADDNKLNIIKSDVLYAKGFAYYSKNDIANAEKINKELIELSKITDDPNLAYNRSILQADIFVAKKDHKHALEIYDKILASTDSTELTIKMQTYEKSYTPMQH